MAQSPGSNRRPDQRIDAEHLRKRSNQLRANNWKDWKRKNQARFQQALEEWQFERALTQLTPLHPIAGRSASALRLAGRYVAVFERARRFPDEASQQHARTALYRAILFAEKARDSGLPAELMGQIQKLTPPVISDVHLWFKNEWKEWQSHAYSKPDSAQADLERMTPNARLAMEYEKVSLGWNHLAHVFYGQQDYPRALQAIRTAEMQSRYSNNPEIKQMVQSHQREIERAMR
jgi:hypothetical protein